jgi:hypothetical protein
MYLPVDLDVDARCATRIERQRPVLNADPRGRAAPIRPHSAPRSLWSTVAWLVVAAACGSADSDEATPPLTSPDSALTTASTLARPGSPSSPMALPVSGATTDHEGPEPSVVTTASTATSTTTIADAPLGRAADELRASCGFVDLGVAPVDLSTLPPLGERAAEVDLSRIEGGAIPFVDGYTWSIASETNRKLGLFGRPPEGSSIDPPFGYALFTRGAGGWDPTSFGQCRIEVSAPGWGNARFVLAAPPTDSPAELSLMATERACASGMPPTNREFDRLSARTRPVCSS